MRLSILVHLTVCMSHVAAFAPNTAVKKQLSVYRLSSHPFASDPFVVSGTEILSNGSEDKTSAAAYARKVLRRYESAIMNNDEPSSITPIEPSTPSVNDKKAPKLPDRSMLVRTLGIARDKPVTKAKEHVAKEVPHRRRTLTPMERKLASEEVLRMDDSIKPVKVGLDSPPIFTEKKADTIPRTGTVEEYSPVPTLSFALQDEQDTPQDTTVHRTLTPVERKESSDNIVREFNSIKPFAVQRSSPPRFTEKPASVTPTTAAAEHRPSTSAFQSPMTEEQERLKVRIAKKTFSPDDLTSSPPTSNGHLGYPNPRAAYAS